MGSQNADIVYRFRLHPSITNLKNSYISSRNLLEKGLNGGNFCKLSFFKVFGAKVNFCRIFENRISFCFFIDVSIMENTLLQW